MRCFELVFSAFLPLLFAAVFALLSAALCTLFRVLTSLRRCLSCHVLLCFLGREGGRECGGGGAQLDLCKQTIPIIGTNIPFMATIIISIAIVIIIVTVMCIHVSHDTL